MVTVSKRKAGLATSARLPAFVEPMQAKLVESLPPGSWIYEIKFDGYRAIALHGGDQVRILSRNEKDLGRKFTEVVDSISGLDVRDAIIDGEIVALDEKGRSSFQLLQAFEMGQERPQVHRRATLCRPAGGLGFRPLQSLITIAGVPSFATFLEPPFDRLALNPVCAQSRFVRCLQAADIAIGCVAAHVAGEEKNSPPIFKSSVPLFYRGNDRIGGYGLKIHPSVKHVNLYHWLLQDEVHNNRILPSSEQLAAGPQHAPELTVDSLSVRNIHDHVLGPHRVETTVRKRQSQEVTDLVADQGVQTGSLRQQLGYGNKRRRKVYADNATAVGATEIARCASQT
jgi:ATP dependent DNA ligase domain